MNVRFAEPCRGEPLAFTGAEDAIQVASLRDGRTQAQLALTCEKDIYLGVFFDGTNNNKYRDTPNFSHSNVARLYEAYTGTPASQTAPTLQPKIKPDGSTEARKVEPDKALRPKTVNGDDFPYYRKIYVPGVGTPMPDVGDNGTGAQKSLGLSMALLGQIRLDWALLQVMNQVHAAVFGAPLEKSITLSQLWKRTNLAPVDENEPAVVTAVRLWSGEMAHREIIEQWDKLEKMLGRYDPERFDELFRSYEKRLAEKLKPRLANKPHLRKIRLSVFGFSRGAAEARAWVNMVCQRWPSALTGIELQIDFLGLFDTVASVGLAQSVPHSNGHFAWAEGENMVVPARVKRCVHLVAAFEVRGSFPLDSVCQGGTLPPNCKEVVYPGVHSDVGGGYPPNDQGRARGNGAAGDKLKPSQLPLVQMYREARMAGVPLALKSEMAADRQSDFEIDPQLRQDFNAYVEATRMGRVPPTNGKGDPAFARMYPTETQPRDALANIMAAHGAYLLQWRKSMLSQGGGVSKLPGLASVANDSKQQDIEDFRGAEEELRKEIAFLQDPNPAKFLKLDDPFLEKIPREKKLSLMTLLGAFSWPKASLSALGYMATWFVHDSIRQTMAEKQSQWDNRFSHVWAGAGALPPEGARAAKNWFENYVHDSRAWFKPFLRSDMPGFSLTPDDEEWFTFGGREKERKQRIGELNKQVEEARKRNDKPALAAAEASLKELQQEGQPLLIGGREPYRMWGYVRYRRIYQSGRLVADAKLQKTIESEEKDRRREAAIEEENQRHQAEIKRIVDRNKEVQNDPKLTSAQKDEYALGASSTVERENRFHEEQLQKLGAKPAEQRTKT